MKMFLNVYCSFVLHTCIVPVNAPLTAKLRSVARELNLVELVTVLHIIMMDNGLRFRLNIL